METSAPIHEEENLSPNKHPQAAIAKEKEERSEG